MKSIALVIARYSLVGYLVLLVSCALELQPSGMPEIGLPADELNQQISLSAPAGLNTSRMNAGIRQLVEVTGSETIIFSPDFGIRSCLYQNEECVEVEQVPTTYAHGDVILPPSGGDPLLTAIAHAFPILPNSDQSALLRVFVFGHVCRDGGATNEAVGAYVDVVLQP